MNIGFIGTGALTSAIVTGLAAATGGAVSVLLSPRNAEISARLADRYPGVRVAADNQAVLDHCDTIMLAVRPQVALEVLSPLRFRQDHHVVSLIATLSRADVANLTAPAARVTKALPMPMIAHGLGATIICPPDPDTAGFFGRLGKVVEIEDPAEFDALGVATATFATYFKYLATLQGWLQDHHVPASTARDYLVTLFKALATAPEVAPGADFMQLADEFATRGGINEQVVRSLTEQNVFGMLAESLNDVHRRITGNTGHAAGSIEGAAASMERPGQIPCRGQREPDHSPVR
jgi:pyrroline-5-carboxylate reductase